MPFSERRFYILGAFPIVIFSVIIIRLFYLQIIKGPFYEQRSQSNFIQARPINHSRGMIFDQNRLALVDNRSAHDLYVTFAMLPSSKKTLKSLANFIDLNSLQLKDLTKKIKEERNKRNPEMLSLGFLDNKIKCDELESFIENEIIEGVQVNYVKNTVEGTCQVKIDPAQFPSRTKTFNYLQQLLRFDHDDFQTYILTAKKKSRGLRQFKPTLLLSDIPFEAYARIESAISLGSLPGVLIFDSAKRRYIHNNFASHALGYLNETSQKEINNNSDLKLGQRIGRKGIERVYEDNLRGKDGVERYVVDAKGRRFSEAWEKILLGKNRITPPVPGQGLVLSIDYKMQKAAEKAFKGKAGSIVALEVGTGYVLALASFPNYNPNEIVARDNTKALKALNNNPLSPWLNKATQENYAPGSTFKAITAIAGFEQNLLTPSTNYNCTGVFSLKKTNWRCFKRDGHGPINIVEALKTSCDGFFYNLGNSLGSENLANTARLMGFGKKTGIDLDLEVNGIIPDKEFYQKRLGYDAPGFVINSAVGQGDVTVTPIQLAVAYDAILNGGKIYKPQLVREIIDVHGNTIKTIRPTVKAHLKENMSDLKLVKKGLSYVMQQGGTARGLIWRSDLPELSKWLRNSKVRIGGKTGTAQVVKLSKHIKHLDPKDVTYLERDHAWFIGFAPVDKPEVVIVAMTEHGGFGGKISAPVVAQLIKTWYEKVRGRGRYANIGTELN